MNKVSSKVQLWDDVTCRWSYCKKKQNILYLESSLWNGCIWDDYVVISTRLLD